MRTYLLLLAPLVCTTALVACDSSPKGEKAAAAPSARMESFGKDSPAIVTNSGNVTIHYGAEKSPQDGPTVIENAPISAVTHGDNSPVVVTKGGSVTINYK